MSRSQVLVSLKAALCHLNAIPTTTSGTVARSGRNTRSKDAYAEFTSTWASTFSPTPKVVQTVRRNPPDLQLRELGDSDVGVLRVLGLQHYAGRGKAQPFHRELAV